MSANFVFRNATDTLYVTSQDLGAIATNISIAPVQFIVKNSGDRVSVNNKVRIIADARAQNTSGTPILNIYTSNTLNPAPGTYQVTFPSNSSAQVDGGDIVTILADGSTLNTNLISGTEIVFNTNPSGSTANVIVSDGYQRAQIAPDISGTYGTWDPEEIEYSHLFCQSMTLLSASLIPGGFLGQTTYYYVVTALTPKGETLISNRVSVTNNSPSQSAQLNWEVYPGAMGYNVYRSSTSGNEKFLINTTETTFIDDGSLPTNNSISYPTSNNIISEKFWIKVDAPTGATDNSNPRRFKLRTIGLSS